MPQATFDVTCDRHAAHRARRWVRQQELHDHVADRPGCEHLLDDVVLCASELVSNAVAAGCASASLGLDVAPDRIRVSLVDDAPATTADRLWDSPADVSRRRLIEAVGARWGVDRASSCQETWVELSLAG